MKQVLSFLFVFLYNSTIAQTVQNIGSMSEMGKENFATHIRLDTLSNKKHLWGMGPYGRMQGEITIFDGKPYFSSVTETGTGLVASSWQVEAPFFVYANVENWKELDVEIAFASIAAIEEWVAEVAKKNSLDTEKPFVFRIKGTFDNLTTHIVMPRSDDVKGYQVGKKQADYNLQNQAGELVGFYSEKHGGIYTHKDSFVHIHFISEDVTQMGHLDKIMQTKARFKLYLPLY